MSGRSRRKGQPLAFESFLLGIMLGVPILALIVFVSAIRDSSFERKVEQGGDRAWVRGDASFQGWFREQTGMTIGYARRMLLVARAERLELYLPRRREPAWRVETSQIVGVGIEDFRSRTVRGRAVRLRLRGDSGFVVRPEIIWLPSAFSPASLAQDLARTLAAVARQSRE